VPERADGLARALVRGTAFRPDGRARYSSLVTSDLGVRCDEGPRLSFDREALRARAAGLHERYVAATPYPYAVIDGFLGARAARVVADRFPAPDHPGWMRRDYDEQSARLGQLQRTGFAGVDSIVRQLLAELSGMAFLDFLSELTGVGGLIADPHFRGAGLTATLRGGHLAVHADFNRDRTRHLDRALTVLYYAAPEWDESWGGALELFSKDGKTRAVSIAPLPDRLCVMAHGDDHFHGHPTPLACPADRFRAVVSAYYYVARASDADREAHGAIWARR